MNREEAARILHPDTRDVEFEKDVTHWGERLDKALDIAIEALRGPWVKTSDRLPTEADADNTMCWVFATTKSSNLPMPEAIAYIRANPDDYPYWMPIPPLQEVEE